MEDKINITSVQCNVGGGSSSFEIHTTPAYTTGSNTTYYLQKYYDEDSSETNTASFETIDSSSFPSNPWIDENGLTDGEGWYHFRIETEYDVISCYTSSVVITDYTSSVVISSYTSSVVISCDTSSNNAAGSSSVYNFEP